MLFDKIVELLIALAVAAAGIAGLDTAADHASPSPNDAALNHRSAHVDDIAAIRAATALDRAAEVLAELDAVGPTNGLAQAAESLTKAMEKAPEAADRGLDRAMEAVTESPAHDAPAGPPAELPTARR